MSQKKIFYLHQDSNLPIIAGGIILYKIFNNNVYLLLIDKNGIFEDLGGKTNARDETIQDTVSREAYEESNYLIDLNSVKKRLQASNYVYNPNSKYITYLIQANNKEIQLKENDFSNKEIQENIPRKIKWISLNTLLNPNIIKYRIACRLKHKNFFDQIKIIKKNMMEWDVITE